MKNIKTVKNTKNSQNTQPEKNIQKINVNEKWCIGCRLCEYHCAFSEINASLGKTDITALKGVKINPRIRVIEDTDSENPGSFPVLCRQCENPLCVMSCLTGAISVRDGVTVIDSECCVGCCTCILTCPFGAVMPLTVTPAEENSVQKCDLCINTDAGSPFCVSGCPNGALTLIQREVQ